MKTYYFSKIAAFTTLLLFSDLAFAGKTVAPDRTMHIAGLVVDAKTLSPVDGVSIYDVDNHLLGSTDKNGYYNVDAKVAAKGEIDISLKLRKSGYQDINQNDHWGNLSDGSKTLFYFGMKKKGDNTTSFSNLSSDSFEGDLSYASAEKHFAKAKTERLFANKVTAAKADNEDIVIKIDGTYYLTDETGWIKLNSTHDLISIDKKQVVTADKLNSLLKRKNIKGMTPVSSASAQFEIYTR